MKDPVAFFRDEAWTAGVIGLGYVGLPLAVNVAQRGLRCIGFDHSDSVVAGLREGAPHVEDVSDRELQEAFDRGLEVTAEPVRLAEADAIFICVPSPLGRNRQPDMTYIEKAPATVTAVARPGGLVSLESTSYPGTTDEFLVPAVTAGGLELDRDVFVCFSPERVDPGNPRRLGEIPKVVGGVSELSGRVGEAAYARLVPKVHLVSSARAAELTKLLENTYRSVNIALGNEMAQLAHQLDIDIWEVIEAAATKPFGFQAFHPGPGVGGHCIPLDPQFLAWRAKEARIATRFIDLAEQVNTAMPIYTAGRIADLLNERGQPVFGSKVLGVGIAYKANVADDRESPAVQVLQELARRGAEVLVLDPHVDPARIKAYGFQPVEDEHEGVAVAVILADHDIIDLENLADRVPLVFDARGAYRRRGLRNPNVTTL